MGKVRMELKVIERKKKKTNFGDDQREWRNWAERVRNYRMNGGMLQSWGETQVTKLK